MDSFILIDGIVLWIILAVLIFQFIVFVYTGIENYKIRGKNIKLKTENKKLQECNDLLKDKYYKATYKTPEVK